MTTCPTCHAPLGKVRTIAEPDSWVHYYACLRDAAHRFRTVEQLTDKPRTDRKQVDRLVRQGLEVLEELARVAR